MERNEDRLQHIAVELGRLGERFRDVAGQTTQPVEWRASYNFPNEALAREARSADVVVIGQHSAADDALHTFDPGSVVLAAGKPVLVAPEGLAKFPEQSVLIAWKDTREARRAVQSAIPFLQIAEQVRLVEVAEETLEGEARAHLDDVEAYLARHRVKVSAKTILGGEGAASEQLKHLARDQRAGLIVAGAYGRTRLGEWIFGGVTRNLLRTAETCCLFSN